MPKNSIFEIAIDVSPEKITATLLPDGKTISLQNFMLIDQKTKQIIATGRSRDEFENMFSLEWEEMKKDTYIESVPIFDGNNFSPEIVASFTLNLLSNFQQNIPSLSNQQPSIAINFPSYGNFDMALRDEFEFILARFARAMKLVVNGQERPIQYKKATFLGMTHLISLSFSVLTFVMLSNFITMRLGEYFNLDEMSTVLDIFICASTIFLPLILLAAFGAWLGEFLWMLIMRMFYPKQFLRNSLLYFYSPRKLKINPLSSSLHKFLLMDRN